MIFSAVDREFLLRSTRSRLAAAAALVSTLAAPSQSSVRDLNGWGLPRALRGIRQASYWFEAEDGLRPRRLRLCRASGDKELLQPQSPPHITPSLLSPQVFQSPSQISSSLVKSQVEKAGFTGINGIAPYVPRPTPTFMRSLCWRIKV